MHHTLAPPTELCPLICPVTSCPRFLTLWDLCCSLPVNRQPSTAASQATRDLPQHLPRGPSGTVGRQGKRARERNLCPGLRCANAKNALHCVFHVIVRGYSCDSGKFINPGLARVSRGLALTGERGWKEIHGTQDLKLDPSFFQSAEEEDHDDVRRIVRTALRAHGVRLSCLSCISNNSPLNVLWISFRPRFHQPCRQLYICVVQSSQMSPCAGACLHTRVVQQPGDLPLIFSMPDHRSTDRSSNSEPSNTIAPFLLENLFSARGFGVSFDSFLLYPNSCRPPKKLLVLKIICVFSINAIPKVVVLRGAATCASAMHIFIGTFERATLLSITEWTCYCYYCDNSQATQGNLLRQQQKLTSHILETHRFV